MARSQVEIHQTTNHSYCRIWDGSSGLFSDLDTASKDYDNASSGSVLWGDNTDYLHIGYTTANNAFMGFKMAVASSGYGTFFYRHGITGGPYTINEISALGVIEIVGELVASSFVANTAFTITGSSTPANNKIHHCVIDATESMGNTYITTADSFTNQGASGTVTTIFKPFTPLYLGQANFTQDGYVAWAIPGTWASTTVNTQAAFWIQISQEAVAPATPAQMYHMLPNLTFNPHVKLEYPDNKSDARVFHDTNHNLQDGDIQNDEYDMALLHTRGLVLTWADYVLLAYWKDWRKMLWVNDLARSASPVFTTDSYIRDFIGKLVQYPPSVYSVLKNDGTESTFEFKIQSANTIPSLLGLTK